MKHEDFHQLLVEYQSIFDSVSDGIYVTDGQGTTLRVNRAFEQITGISAEDIRDRSVRELLSSGVFDKSVTLKVLETRSPQSMMETLPNGREALLTGIPVLDSGGEVHRVVTTLRDMAELNELKQDLARTVEISERYRMELLQLRLNQIKMDNVVIFSPEMKRVMRTALQLGDVDSTVLITGESGVGKEIVARAIHRAGRGEQAPMIATNCSAIPEALLESELFGYERGAFTGAEKSGKPGLFEVARGGTLFLDEIGDVSLNIQVKLLRALHEKEILRVGGRSPVKIDVRVIAATNRDLETLVEEGKFRRDLYYRLNVIPLHIPALRDRRSAIIPLIKHFLDHFNRRFNREVKFSSRVMQAMENWSWPGNVRELENTVERLVVLADGTSVDIDQMPGHIAAGYQPDHPLGTETGCDDAEFDTASTASGAGSPAGDNSGSPELPRLPTDLGEAIDAYEARILGEAWKRYGSTRKLAAALNISQSTAVRKLSRHRITEL
jgi:PAS domain S-box-containing protein/TyrR family helix-turn-helix protein